MIEESSEPSIFVRAYNCAMAAVRGVRTVGVALVVMLAGVADQFDLVDLLHTVRSLFGESAKIGGILVAVAAVFFLLRLVTKGPAGFGKGRVEGDVSSEG